MDDTACHDFFHQPTQTLHRRYEALRAFFVERRGIAEIAQAFDYRYGTLRNLIANFRAQCQAHQTPPFSSNPPAARNAVVRKSMPAGPSMKSPAPRNSRS